MRATVFLFLSLACLPFSVMNAVQAKSYSRHAVPSHTLPSKAKASALDAADADEAEIQAYDVTATTLRNTVPPASAYPNAGALVYRDESTVHLNANGTYFEDVHETVRIYNERGRRYADVQIPFDESTQVVTSVHGRTILPSGKIMTVKHSDIYESSPYSDYAMYDDAKAIAFSMPGVEDGAIIDYTYEVVTRKALLADQYTQHWWFQERGDPVRLSRFTLIAPISLPLHTQINNAPGLAPIEKTLPEGVYRSYIWEMWHLPDIAPEPMMPPAAMTRPWLEVSTIPSWQTIAHWYQGLAESRTTPSPEIKTLVKQLTAGKTTDTDKAKALFYWVEGKTRYVALELGMSAFQPHAAAEVCANRYGDCKDMATLLLTMLHEAGIKTAWPVLLHADSKASLHDRLASPGEFNHAIVRADIDGKPYWFDSTAELCPFGEIPGGDRGADAFVIRDGQGAFEKIPLGTPDDNRMAETTKTTLSADGSADCVTTFDTSGDADLSIRSTFRTIKPEQVKNGLRSMVRDISPNAILGKYTLSPLEDRDTPLGFTCDYHAPLWATKTGNLIILPGGDTKGLNDKAFDSADRKYPLYQDESAKIVTTSVITLPPGYTVDDKPSDLHQQTPLGNYDLTYTLSGSTLTVHEEETVIPATVPPADYAQVKAEHDAMVKALKQPVVLKLTAKS